MVLLLVAWLSVGALAAVAARAEPAVARAAAVLVMCALALAALVPPRSVPVTVPARIGIATSGAPGVADVAAMVAAAAGRDGQGALVTCVGDRALPTALAQAAVRAGPRAEEVVAVWNGTLAANAPLAAPVAGASYTTAAPLPWSPAELSLLAIAPPQAGRPLRLEASVAGAAAPVAATVAIDSGAGPVAQAVQLPPIGAVAIDGGVASAGSCTVAVQVELGAHRIERRGTFAVTAPSPVLVLDPSGAVAAALQAQGVAIEQVATLPADLTTAAGLVLGVPLDLADQQRLSAAVDDGLGLFALGPGLQSEGEPLRAMWPVRLQKAAVHPGRGDAAAPPPELPPAPDVPPADRRADGARPEAGVPQEVDRHAIAMVFVVDRSDSMGTRLPGGATKMSFVKTSAQRTAAVLGDGDQVGIVTFGNQGQGRTVLPLTAASDRAAVAAGIAGLAHAHEYTFLRSGLALAAELLRSCRAAVRHVVVLTDGEFFDNVTTIRSDAHDMLGTGLTVSIVSIVDGRTDADFLKNCELIARDGGGEFLPVDDASRVPQLVSAEVVRALGKVGRAPGRGDGPLSPSPSPVVPPAPHTDPPPPPVPERLVVRAVARSPLLLPAVAEWPSLRGAVGATATVDAHVLLVAGDQGQPLLAYGNRGLGRVGVFAADLAGGDGTEFRADAAFPARLSQWVTAVARALPHLPTELLTQTRVMPPAPTPDEVAQLTAAAGAPRPFAALQLPPPRRAYEYRSQVSRWAAAAVGLLVLLAALERWAARRFG